VKLPVLVKLIPPSSQAATGNFKLDLPTHQIALVPRQPASLSCRPQSLAF